MKRPAQRRRILHSKNKEKSRIFGIFIKFSILVALIIGIFVFVKLSTRYWDGHNKFGFSFINSGGEVSAVVLDPVLNEITSIKIPGETEVNVARSYGTLRIKNVWKLSQNEKLGGILLPETITQNFLFPMTLWSDTDAKNIVNQNFFGVVKFIFLPVSTNIPFGDRLSIGIFALKIHDLDKTEIDMGKSQFLHKEKLSDGQIGYRLVNGISERLGVYFSDNDIANRNLKVYIVDATGKNSVASLVGQIVEVLGGKIVSVDKKQDLGNFDCQVLGSDKKIDKRIASLFSCTILSDKTDFDLEIRLGTKFVKRF